MSRLERILLALALVLGLVIEFEACSDMRYGYTHPELRPKTLADVLENW